MEIEQRVPIKICSLYTCLIIIGMVTYRLFTENDVWMVLGLVLALVFIIFGLWGIDDDMREYYKKYPKKP